MIELKRYFGNANGHRNGHDHGHANGHRNAHGHAHGHAHGQVHAHATVTGRSRHSHGTVTGRSRRASFCHVTSRWCHVTSRLHDSNVIFTVFFVKKMKMSNIFIFFKFFLR
jgi:hypothetical protein